MVVSCLAVVVCKLFLYVLHVAFFQHFRFHNISIISFSPSCYFINFLLLFISASLSFCAFRSFVFRFHCVSYHYYYYYYYHHHHHHSMFVSFAFYFLSLLPHFPEIQFFLPIYPKFSFSYPFALNSYFLPISPKFSFSYPFP